MEKQPDRKTPGWEPRPAVALVVRVLVLAVPMLAGVAVAVVVTRALPRPTTALGLLGLWLVGFSVSTLVLFGLTRQARRLLPLAALLELSLTFPDHTPSRVGVALRAGNLGSAAKRQAALATAAGSDRAEGVAAVLALAAALSAHDRATRGHSERVRAYTELICEELRLPAEDRLRLRWASLLHDVGKMAVPASLLNKTGALDDDEWATLRRHPEEGARLTASLATWLGPWAAAVAHHHERWDGKGYPDGLGGTDIQLGARIVAVADAYEVMTSARAYKEPFSPAEARRRLAADAGHQFDPVVVRAFLNVSLGRLRIGAGALTWLAQLPFLRPATAAVARGPAPIVLSGAVAVAAVTLALPTIPELPPLEDQAAAVRSTPWRDAAPPTDTITLAVADPPPATPVAVFPALAPAVPASTGSGSGPPPPPTSEAPGPAPVAAPPGDDPAPLVHVSVHVVPLDPVVVDVGEAEGSPFPPLSAEVELGA